MMRRFTATKLVCLAIAMGTAACNDSDVSKVPLGGSAGDPAAPRISGEARIALDSGNALFRAKAYDKALERYRRSADLSPKEVSPLLGIMMVADVKKDSKLAADTRARIRKLDPTVADSSAAMAHSKIIEAHPRPAPLPPPST